jgi:hypothetical protein
VTCERTDMLIDLLEDELESAARTEVEAHLEGCAACQAELDDYRGLSLGLRGLEPERPSQEARDTAYQAVLAAMSAANPGGAEPSVTLEDPVSPVQRPSGILIRFLQGAAAAACLVIAVTLTALPDGTSQTALAPERGAPAADPAANEFQLDDKDAGAEAEGEEAQSAGGAAGDDAVAPPEPTTREDAEPSLEGLLQAGAPRRAELERQGLRDQVELDADDEEASRLARAQPAGGTPAQQGQPERSPQAETAAPGPQPEAPAGDAGPPVDGFAPAQDQSSRELADALPAEDPPLAGARPEGEPEAEPQPSAGRARSLGAQSVPADGAQPRDDERAEGGAQVAGGGADEAPVDAAPAPGAAAELALGRGAEPAAWLAAYRVEDAQGARLYAFRDDGTLVADAGLRFGNDARRRARRAGGGGGDAGDGDAGAPVDLDDAPALDDAEDAEALEEADEAMGDAPAEPQPDGYKRAEGGPGLAKAGGRVTRVEADAERKGRLSSLAVATAQDARVRQDLLTILQGEASTPAEQRDATWSRRVVVLLRALGDQHASLTEDETVLRLRAERQLFGPELRRQLDAAELQGR